MVVAYRTIVVSAYQVMEVAYHFIVVSAYQIVVIITTIGSNCVPLMVVMRTIFVSNTYHYW